MTAPAEVTPSPSPIGVAHTNQTTVKGEDDYDEDFLMDEDQDDGDEEEGTYRSRLKLAKPAYLLRTLQYFMRGLEDKTINVNPEYQREVVWTAERMTGLIDSLMEHYYIPPIILNKKTLSADATEPGARRKPTYVCVDGKQRLSSVKLFVTGHIPCHDHKNEKWFFCDNGIGSRRKRILPDHVKKKFLSIEFVSFEFSDLSPEQEEDLFARVQMGVQLSAAEKMRAQTGPWQELARCYVEDFPSLYKLLKDRTRAKDFQITLSCFSQIIEVKHPTPSNGIPMLKTNHSHLPKLLANKDAVDDAIKSELASIWNTFQDLINLDPTVFTNENKYLKGVQTFAPLEFVAVTVLISMYSDTRNNKMLLGDIKLLREELRRHHTDLRLNVPTWKWTWEFIDDLEAIRGSVNGPTIDRSVKAKPAPKPAASTPSASTGSKRGQGKARDSSSVPLNTNSVDSGPSDDPRPAKKKRTEPSTAHSDSGFLPAPVLPPSTSQMARRTSASKTIRPPRISAIKKQENSVSGVKSTSEPALTNSPSKVTSNDTHTLPARTRATQGATTPASQAHPRPFPQYDGCIDLTEDDDMEVEAEAENLLSSFKASR